MPERQGLIPLRERVNELRKIYERTANDIKDELLRFDIGDFQEIKAMKTDTMIFGHFFSSSFLFIKQGDFKGYL